MDPLKDILRNNYFIIPTNQRGFSWKKQHAEALTNDLDLMGHSSHYMGTIIVTWAGEEADFQDEESRDHTKGYILNDGQQRITTFLLLIHCLVDRFEKIGKGEDRHAEELRNFLTYFKGEKQLRIQNKQRDLQQFLEHLFLGAACPRSRTAPMDALQEVFNYFSEFVGALGIDELIDWKLKISAQAKFILVDLKDGNIDRYLAFDAINSRGLPLTEFDKIKNFCALLSQRRPGLESSRPESSWYKSLENLERYDVTTRNGESAFITELHSVFVQKRVSQDKIHEDFVDNFNELLGVNDSALEKRLGNYIKGWKPYAAAFGFITSRKRKSIDPNAASAEANASLSNIDHMNLLGITRPLLCAGFQQYSKHDFQKLASWCEIYTFRVHALAQKRTDKNSRGIIWLAHMILFEGISVDDVRQQLCKWLDDIAPLQLAFEFLINGGARYPFDAKMKGWSHCYYFLYQYELSIIHGGAFPPAWQESVERQKSSIEHILPQSHRDRSWWETHWPNGDLAEKYKHRLGNLVLTNNNSSLGQKSFPLKLDDQGAPYCYNHNNATNSEKLIRDYTNGTRWQTEEILKREAALVEFALKRWTIGCCSDNGSYMLPDEFKSAVRSREIIINENNCASSLSVNGGDSVSHEDELSGESQTSAADSKSTTLKI